MVETDTVHIYSTYMYIGEYELCLLNLKAE